MSDQKLVVLNQRGGAKASVGIRIEREVNGVMMGVLTDGTAYMSQWGLAGRIQYEHEGTYRDDGVR